MLARPFFASVILVASVSAALAADRIELLTGVNVRNYPGANRFVAPNPGPGFPGTFNDGDRLAGTANDGPTVNYQGIGTPLYQPNQFGALSFMFRRGSVPIGGGQVVPWMAIDFIGGPRLDLDGDLNNGVRSLVPVGATPAELLGVGSFFDLSCDFEGQRVVLEALDAGGNNEGGPNIQPEIATILVNIAGTGGQGQSETPPNPTWDTRTGSLTPFTGTGGTLSGVYRIQNLQCEIWQDSIDANSPSPDTLGSMQYFADFRGWLVQRNPGTHQFPTLAGEGLGTTLWPAVDASQIGAVYNTAHGLFGGTATIAAGKAADNYTVAGNGGLALTDFGGDLGAYLDAVVAPTAGPSASAYVYLESAGFGISNTNDPLFTDTVAYDVVLIGATRVCNPCDTNCDGTVNLFDIQSFVNALSENPPTPCSPCVADTNGDGSVNLFDIQGFVQCLGG